MGQFLDHRLIAVDLPAHCFDRLAHGLDLRQQLRSECPQLVGSHSIEIGRGSHAVDFTNAGHLQQPAKTLITVFKAA